MPTPFLSSEEYDERAHQLYNEGQYDEALTVLREGLALYPNSVELHVGVGYARLAREEYAWARRAFEEALVLEPEHEDGLAGLGETLLKFGQEEAAIRCFNCSIGSPMSRPKKCFPLTSSVSECHWPEATAASADANCCRSPFTTRYRFTFPSSAFVRVTK